MSTKVVRSLTDFLRHGYDIDVECRCGHSAILNARAVHSRFSQKGWSMSLEGAAWLPSVHARFYCTSCWAAGRGKVRPKHIGPKYR